MTDKPKIDAGGPAYPYETRERCQYSGTIQTLQHPGNLSLRDWFAGHAPPMPDQWLKDTMVEKLPKGTHHVNALVAWGYFYADAMIAARKEPT